MEQRARWLWITFSAVWILSCALVLQNASRAELTRQLPAAAAAAAAAAATSPGTNARHSGSGVVVVVMPSPPMVSGPLTRIDRLETIYETWGRVLVGLGDNRVVFVVDESDSTTAEEASRTWGVLDASPSSRNDDPKLRRKLSNQEADFRAIVVPDEITQGGKDGDARLRHVLATISETHNPGFLFFCNEHTFVIAENLLCYVDGLDPSEPVYLGNRFRRENAGKEEESQRKPLLNSGAAGFVLSRASLSLLKRAWRGGGGEGGDSAIHLRTDGDVDEEDDVDERGGGGVESQMRENGGGGSSASVPPPECVATSDYERGNPGITLARCLDHVGVRAQDTADTKGGQRFNAYGPVRLAQGKIDQWYKDVHATDPGKWRAGPDCCSADTVSFHYVGPAEARAMHRILHHRETYLTEGYDEALRLWPSSPQDLGPYAARPRAGDPTFDLLLNKISICPSA